MTWSATLRVVGRVGRSDASDRPPLSGTSEKSENYLYMYNFRAICYRRDPETARGCRTKRPTRPTKTTTHSDIDALGATP